MKNLLLIIALTLGSSLLNLIHAQTWASDQQVVFANANPSENLAPSVHFAAKVDLLWPIINQYRGRDPDFRFSIESEFQRNKNQRISLVADIDFRVFEGYINRFWRPNIWETGFYREHAIGFTSGGRWYFLRKVFSEISMQGVFLEPGLSLEYRFGEIVSPLVADVEEKYSQLGFDWRFRTGVQGHLFPRLLVSASLEFSNRQFAAEGVHRYSLVPEINIGYQLCEKSNGSRKEQLENLSEVDRVIKIGLKDEPNMGEDI